MQNNYKIVLLGDTGVGKSSLALRYARGVFFDCCESTVGAAFLTAPATVDGREISLEIWDTAGQERYASLAPMYYRGAVGALVVYDITRPNTFEAAKRWIRELRANLDGCSIVLVANKIDMDPGPATSRHEARKYADDNSLHFVETSAKRAVGVSDAFHYSVACLSSCSVKVEEPDTNSNLLIVNKDPPSSHTASISIKRRRNPCRCYS